MDTSSNMDNLDDSSSLPELSFDDLLDSSPIKKNGKQAVVDEDSLDFEYEYEEHKTTKNDSLNTPCPKRSRMIPRTITNSYITTKAVPIRANPMKAGVSSMTSYAKTNSGGGSGGTGGNAAPAPPVLLNAKNILPKMATQITNNSIKLTPKNVASTAGNGGGAMATATMSSGVNMTGKTAVRTATGQVIYIQKTPSNSSTTSAIKTGNTSTATTLNVKQQTTTGAGGGGAGGTGNKPMTIQVMRNPDGSFVPLKSAAGSNGKNTTLTLSPTTLTGKKIVTSTGGQVVIKSATTTGAMVNPSSTIKTVVKATAGSATSSSSNESIMAKPKTIVVQQSGGDTKTKTILVQSNNGKQFLVSNPNLVKLSPKTQVTTTNSGATTSSTSSGAGSSQQLQAIQLPGKQGVQYVRVMPANKAVGGAAAAKPTTVTSTAAVTSSANTVRIVTSTAAATTSTTAATANTSAPMKILNNLPQKFTVVQKGGGTKVVVTQKKDANGVEFMPIASKVQKTIVTMPVSRSTNDENPKPQQTTILTKTPQGFATTSGGSQTLMRKHKISEINSELQRITKPSDAEDSGGPPDIKKPANNNRVVVISSNAPTILNNSIQQPGRVTSMLSSSSSNTFSASSGGGATQVQGTRIIASSSNNNSSLSNSTTTTTTTIAAGNKLYTILKPSSSSATGQQNTTTKLYSVLKTSKISSGTTNSQPTFTTPNAISAAVPTKPLLNKQSLIQQQQKIFHFKQLQKNKLYQASHSVTSTSTASGTPSLVIKSSTSTFCPVKIKEEPLEYFDSSKTSSLSALVASSSFNAPSTSAATNATQLQTLSSMVSAEILQDDPNKIDLVGGVRRKHCNCSKSQCLKLYCDCFANGEFCQDCTCKDCCNNLENEDERQRAIRSCLDRNPSAFKPKITSSSNQGDMRLHNKGCNCKRSGCLKNYCECYEAKIPCSGNCKCVGCRNVEDRPDLDMDPVDPKVLASIANASGTAGQKRSYDKSQSNVSIKSEKYGKDGIKLEAGMEGSDAAPAEKQQCNFITQEVVDATIQCMVTQADECEKNGLPAYQMEKMIMEELGRCLVEIIDFSIRNTDTSYTQD